METVKKLTAEEILQKIQEYKISWDDLGYDEVRWENYDFGKVENVDDYGGEGQGETFYVVYHFIDHDVYIKIDGWYQSYNGAEFETAPFEVRPVEKMVIFYEKVK